MREKASHNYYDEGQKKYIKPNSLHIKMHTELNNPRGFHNILLQTNSDV